MWYSHITEYYSIIERNSLLPHAITYCYMLSHWWTSKTVRSVKESVTKDHIWRVSVYMKCSSSLSTHNLCSCFYWELLRALGITRCLTLYLAWAVLCSVGGFSRVRLLATPTTSAHQAPLSILPIFPSVISHLILLLHLLMTRVFFFPIQSDLSIFFFMASEFPVLLKKIKGS